VNYRHAFHAGNFADLAKHAALTVLLDRMTRIAGPLTVIDTHAGAGAYDLTGDMARRSGEAEAGIVRLMGAGDAPEAFEVLIAATARINEGAGVRLYPGSPMLIAASLRPGDRLIACELRPDDHAHLANLMGERAEILQADGFAIAPARIPGKTPVLIHIDPPYERGDDYRRCVQAAAEAVAKNSAACVMIWLPLKDLETFDRFLRDLETSVRRPVLIAETRLRPLDDPLKMNGCALAILSPPAGIEGPVGEICRWIAHNLGQNGGEARVWNL